jgi:hypothetical protein
MFAGAAVGAALVVAGASSLALVVAFVVAASAFVGPEPRPST